MYRNLRLLRLRYFHTTLLLHALCNNVEYCGLAAYISVTVAVYHYSCLAFIYIIYIGNCHICTDIIST